jgi:DNA polymerase III alpha subunit
MLANGYSEHAFNVLWRSLESFAEYAFNKAHSAGYGLISYQTAYLKANYPNEFFAALLNTELNNKDKTALYLLEAKNFGVNIAQPDVNQSGLYYLATSDGVIFGLTGIRNVGEKFVEMIVRERELNGPFQSFDDFVNRVPSQVLNKKIIESLIKAGAFDSIHPNRKALYMSQGDKIEQALTVKHKQEQEGQLDLFVTSESDYSFLDSAPIPQVKDWSKDLRLQYEQEMLGFYLSDHPLSQLSDLLDQLSSSSIAALQNLEAPVVDQTAAELAPKSKSPTRKTATQETTRANLNNLGSRIDVTLAGLVTNFERRTSKRGNPYANFTLEDLSGSVQCSLFGNAYYTYHQALYDNVIAQVFARYEPGSEGRTTSLVVNEVNIVDALAKERYAQFFEDSPRGSADAALISQRMRGGTAVAGAEAIGETAQTSTEHIADTEQNGTEAIGEAAATPMGATGTGGETEVAADAADGDADGAADGATDAAADGVALIVKLTLEDCFPDRLDLLKKALRQYPGEQVVIFKLIDGGTEIKRFQLGDQYRVTDSPSLRNQIYNVLRPRVAKIETSVWESNALTRNSF